MIYFYAVTRQKHSFFNINVIQTSEISQHLHFLYHSFHNKAFITSMTLTMEYQFWVITKSGNYLYNYIDFCLKVTKLNENIDAKNG